MLGHSMGGYITLAFAEKYSSALTSFGLIHSSALADTEEKKINRQKGIELMEKYGAYSFLKNTIPNLFSAHTKEANPEIVESLIEASKQFSTKACQQYYAAMKDRTDRTHILKGNPLPVLFVIGTEDVAAPMKDVLPQTKLPVCSYIHVIENVGHMSMLEAPELLNNYLLEFITV
jgi:pimeloyl-ACP methyl ester carboxylesterase